MLPRVAGGMPVADTVDTVRRISGREDMRNCQAKSNVDVDVEVDVEAKGSSLYIQRPMSHTYCE